MVTVGKIILQVVMKVFVKTTWKGMILLIISEVAVFVNTVMNIGF
jgi:hypothetical protein